MTYRPEHVEPRTDTQRLADDITTAMTALTHDWPHMIRPGETQAPGMASRSGVLLDDHDTRDADQNRITKILSLRRYAQDQLNAWARVIIEDRPITSGATLPSGTDVPGMAQFIRRHADWLSGHDTAQDARDELTALARNIHHVVAPPVKEHINLGSCPLEVEFNPANGPQVCGGQVRAWPQLPEMTRDEAAHQKLPECRRCGTEAAVDWWYAHMFPDAGVSHLVTADELIGVIAVRLHWVVTHEQIRQWKHRTKIEGAGRDSKGRTLYRHDDVIAAIRGDVQAQREKAGI